MRAKNCPLGGLVTGATPFTVMVTKSTVAPAPTATPPAVMMMLTVLFVGSAASSPHVATPAAKGVQLTNSSVPGSSAIQPASAHASETCVVPNSVAAAGLLFVGSLVLVLVMRIVIVICSSTDTF